MHLYNAWLPPPVAEETKKEKDSFRRVLNSVKDSYKPDDPDSVYSTLKWVSVLELFIKAKSELNLEDVAELVQIGIELFNISQNKLYAQVRWGNLLVRVLNKYRKKLAFKVQWRPLYDTLIHTHFSRNTGPEGWRLRQRHFQTITSLVRSCRRFFPVVSLLENPWHNSAFEGSGFVRLFLPTNLENQDFYTDAWVKKSLDSWDSIPNSQFWNNQWAAVIARVIKNYNFIKWECFLPTLFSRYLNMFEVPVANGSASYPFSVDVPRYTRFLFSNKTATPAKAIAKSIVYLLKPGSAAQQHFEKLINLLEQYYHPSNGGRWTYSLERFLLNLVITFQKRLQREQQSTDSSRQADMFLGRSERTFFVNVLLKLIDRGQYSKDEHLSETVAATTSILSYVEPTLVLPFLASRFHLALETVSSGACVILGATMLKFDNDPLFKGYLVLSSSDYASFITLTCLFPTFLSSQMTATHQLKTAVMSVAYAGRSLCLTSLSSTGKQEDCGGGDDAYVDLLTISLSNALLGMDANDPPKTMATMQLLGSIFSNIATLDDNTNQLSFLPMIQFSEWLDEFLCRLFSLLQHLEPGSVLNEGLHSSATSGTFLVDDGPFYYCMLEILLGRLSKSLYNQKKLQSLLVTNILPGAVAEVGLLCCACVHSNPEEAVASLVDPILSSVISSLKGTPATGFGGSGIPDAKVSIKAKPTLSPALETAIDYQLKILSVAINYGGPALLSLQESIQRSYRVNGAGAFSWHPAATALEEWISAKDYNSDGPLMGPKWHVPVMMKFSLQMNF
ncbi:hypothetical protein NC653_004676 [Populus alba x Populus x berolinensis]|uniref:Proteasome activator Blm10 middle HEAT repeats region domain-containing protein n=1 Tax=Populus alba x Populus x berolinensis TaxID=444605 RepID=A0AAD6RVF1_9ROSI|nr:hypothetical protein NC653_004676 [Populus alba x Populus x berolinensis]